MVALQIRDVPEAVRDALAAEASRRGLSLQSLLLELVTQEARFQRNVEIFRSTAHLRVELPSPDDPASVESIIREGRDQGFEVDRA